MNEYPYFIASYPRSGSTWLRFILCHLFQPSIPHTMATVDRFIPYVDGADAWRAAVDRPLFIKSHRVGHNRDRVIWVYRHVGDVLISEWWYKQKFGGEARPLVEYLEADDWGAGWRAHVDYYFPCQLMLEYGELADPFRVWQIINQITPHYSFAEVGRAAAQCSFLHLQEVEQQGFGIYPSGDLNIKFFRKGCSDQWRSLPEKLQEKIIQKNYIQLRMLGYESTK